MQIADSSNKKEGTTWERGCVSGNGQQGCNKAPDRHLTGVTLLYLKGWDSEEDPWESVKQAGKKKKNILHLTLLDSFTQTCSSQHTSSGEWCKPAPCTVRGVVNRWGNRDDSGRRRKRHGFLTKAGETWDPATSPVYKQDMAAREAIVQCYNSLPLFVVFPIVWPMLISHCQDSVPCEQRTTVYKQRGQRIEVLKGNMLFLLAQYQLKRKRYLWKQEAMIHPFVCLYISSP